MPFEFPRSFFAAAGVLAIAAVFAVPCRAAKPPKHPTLRPAIASVHPEQDSTIGLMLTMDKNIYEVPVVKPEATSAAVPQMHATLTFFNHSQTPLRIAVGGLPCTWQILDAQGKVVWDYAVGRAIPHFLRIVTLQNSQLRYAQIIPLQTQDGTPLPPGRYTLRSEMPRVLSASASLDFTVTQ